MNRLRIERAINSCRIRNNLSNINIIFIHLSYAVFDIACNVSNSKELFANFNQQFYTSSDNSILNRIFRLSSDR